MGSSPAVTQPGASTRERVRPHRRAGLNADISALRTGYYLSAEVLMLTS